MGGAWSDHEFAGRHDLAGRYPSLVDGFFRYPNRGAPPSTRKGTWMETPT